MVAKKQSDENADDPSKQAFQVMQDVRNALHKRLVRYVLKNANNLRDEASSTENYSFLLQQMDEQLLSKLCVANRALNELHVQPEIRENQPVLTTYEAVEVTARREDLPQKIADALAEHSESDFLNMSVLRSDDQQAEVLLLLARQDTSQAGVVITAAQPAAAQPGAEIRARGDQNEQVDLGNVGPNSQSGSAGQTGQTGKTGPNESSGPSGLNELNGGQSGKTEN